MNFVTTLGSTYCKEGVDRSPEARGGLKQEAGLPGPSSFPLLLIFHFYGYLHLLPQCHLQSLFLSCHLTSVL